jgi:hypothetical protein
MIFSESDRLYWEFEEKYLNVYQNTIRPYSANFEIKLVKDANHVFSFKEWQNDMLNLSVSWIRKNFIFPKPNETANRK